MERYIIDFARCDDSCLSRVGGKSVGLGTMIRAGVPVPPGFAVTTNAYLAAIRDAGIEAAIADLLAGVHPEDVDALEEISVGIRERIEASAIPSEVEAAVRDAYEELSGRCGYPDGDLPVAVRSSATAEDLPGASFAGQQDTYLWIVGADAVLTHVRRCWSSLYTARAIAYRIEQGFAHTQVAMSVCVQKMVNARAAGVMFTLNPSNGDRSKVAIDAAWGLGEAVASGEVTPDNYLVDKIVLEIVRKTVSPKAVEYRPDVAERRMVRREVEPARREAPCLTDEEVLALARYGRLIEGHHGRPQDLEWAVDADLEPPENIVLLQARPETVWSTRQRENVTSAEGSTLDHIVANLLTGGRLRGGG